MSTLLPLIVITIIYAIVWRAIGVAKEQITRLNIRVFNLCEVNAEDLTTVYKVFWPILVLWSPIIITLWLANGMITKVSTYLGTIIKHLLEPSTED